MKPWVNKTTGNSKPECARAKSRTQIIAFKMQNSRESNTNSRIACVGVQDI